MKTETKRNLMFTAVVLLLAAVLYFIASMGKANGKKTAQIYYDSKLVKSVELLEGQDGTFSIPEKEAVVFRLYPDGSIGFESSDCPDKVCVKAGRLHTPGQSAACLPNKLILKIVGEQAEDGVDAVGN